MGMAASQARYLELTARKTNVEYQGQQINQQRTQLANESAGLFNQLMGLQVPTAPSSSDFTKMQYSFSDGNTNYTITNIKNLTGDTTYNKTVTYYSNQDVDTGLMKTRSDLGVKINSGTYWLTNGSTTSEQAKLTQCSSSDTNVADELNSLLKICQATTDTTTTPPTLSSLATALGYDSTTKTIPDSSKITNAFYYKNNGVTYYYAKSDLDTAAAKSGAATTMNGYYESTISKKVYSTCPADLESVDSGRYNTVKLKDFGTTAFDLTATSTTDNNAYNDAVNEYEYKQELYQQETNKINGKTSVIQNEDKVLELQLRQLDTEQQALSTEMEAVKKVIDKNIESTFKTFSS